MLSRVAHVEGHLYGRPGPGCPEAVHGSRARHLWPARAARQVSSGPSPAPSRASGRSTRPADIGLRQSIRKPPDARRKTAKAATFSASKQYSRPTGSTLPAPRHLLQPPLPVTGSRGLSSLAAIVLAVLHCDQRLGDLASGNGIHRTTVTRWVREVVGLLATRAPRLDRAMKKIARTGGGVVLLDDSLIRTRRRTSTANRKNYSGEHKCHGLLVIALTGDKGRLIWVSAARPGRASEITACRHDKLTAHLRAAGLEAIAHLGFIGLDDIGPDTDPAVITGYKAARNRPLTRSQKLSNTALASVRAPVEHSFAHLKTWRILGKVRTDPKWATTLVRALLVLMNREIAR